MVKVKGILNKRGLDELSRITLLCKCGHSITIPVQKDYVICTHCGHKVKNTTLEHFKYNIIKRMK